MKSMLVSAALAAISITVCAFSASADVYQWSVPLPGVVSKETASHPDAYLWVPAHCQHVRAVILGQHNLLEEPLFENDDFRFGLAKRCVGEIWVTPIFDTMFDFTRGSGAVVDQMMKDLATVSGYSELAFVPIVPVGHSAAASFPWNFGASNPDRTLAIISLKGDAPLTPMTGSGKPNPEWGGRSIDGIPALMVMGEYEWVEGRLDPALAFEKAHPLTPLSLYADAGHGHFDISKDLVRYLALFIRKAVDARIEQDATAEHPAKLKSVDPAIGWRADRWHFVPSRVQVSAAPAGRYKGSLVESFWYFDGQMARLAQTHYRQSDGKAPQLLGFVQDGFVLPQTPSHAQVELGFKPLDDGISFHLKATYLDAVPGGSANPARWTRLPVGASIGHATGAISIVRETGPVVQTGPDTWAVELNRVGMANTQRSGDAWFVAVQKGDRHYKSAVQQALLKVPLANTTGADQKIAFKLPAMVNLRQAQGGVTLNGSSDSGLPVRYYVKQGPAIVSGKTLRFVEIPRSARWPIKVSIVAWQYGISGKIRSAAPVEQTLMLYK